MSFVLFLWKVLVFIYVINVILIVDWVIMWLLFYKCVIFLVKLRGLS